MVDRGCELGWCFDSAICICVFAPGRTTILPDPFGQVLVCPRGLEPLHASCPGPAGPKGKQSGVDVAQLVPADASADLSSSALAQYRSVPSGLFEPAGSLEKEEETRPPRPSQLACCLEVVASLVFITLQGSNSMVVVFVSYWISMWLNYLFYETISGTPQ